MIEIAFGVVFLWFLLCFLIGLIGRWWNREKIESASRRDAELHEELLEKLCQRRVEAQERNAERRRRAEWGELSKDDHALMRRVCRENGLVYDETLV
jgi:hypothetical protein